MHLTRSLIVASGSSVLLFLASALLQGCPGNPPGAGRCAPCKNINECIQPNDNNSRNCIDGVCVDWAGISARACQPGETLTPAPAAAGGGYYCACKPRAGLDICGRCATDPDCMSGLTCDGETLQCTRSCSSGTCPAPSTCDAHGNCICAPDAGFPDAGTPDAGSPMDAGTCTVALGVTEVQVNPGGTATASLSESCTGGVTVSSVASTGYPGGIMVSRVMGKLEVACDQVEQPGTYAGHVVFMFSDGSMQTQALTVTVVRPSVSITAMPAAVVVSPGQSASTTITVTDTVGATGDTAVTVTGLPTGVTAAPLTVPSGSLSGTLMLTAAASAPMTSAVSATVNAAQGALMASTMLSVSVQPPPPGSVDPTFATQGVLTKNLSMGSTDTATGAALLSGDAIAVVGATKPSGGSAQPYVAKLTSSGTLDNTFGSMGVLAFNWGSSGGTANAVTVTGAGALIVVGATAGQDFAVARITGAGALDSTFGDGSATGQATTGGALSFASANAVALQTDGKIVAVGNANHSGNAIAVVRWLADGSARDSTFNTATGPGYTYVSFGMSSYAYGVAIQADGKIIVAGHAGSPTSSAQLALARLNTDGSLDNTFGTGGKVMLTNGSVDVGYAALLQGTNVLVAGGAGISGEKFLTARIGMGGTLDTTFGSSGYSTLPVTMGSADYSEAHALAVQADGKLLLAGFAVVGGKKNAGVVRLSATGTPDTSFQGNNASGTGAVSLPVTNGSDLAQAVLQQSGGRIIVVGTGNAGTGSSIFVVGLKP